MKYTGMNMGAVKKKNRSSILNYICETGPVSRKDIALATGLTPAAVTLICNEFMEQGLLKETGELTSSQSAGRKKVLLDLNYEYAYIIAVNIDKEQTTIALTNMKADAIEIHTLSSQAGCNPQKLLDNITVICKEIIERNLDLAKQIAGVSVGIAGLVDKESGKSIHAYGIWEEEVDVCAILKASLNLPVVIENNVNALARAELLFGTLQQKENLLVVKWGPGVGSTIVIDHEIYDGREQKAAELGHYIVERGGKKCQCGKRGCLETIVSYDVLSKDNPFPMDQFGLAYEQASKNKKQQQFDEAIDVFARAIINCFAILAPDQAVICGMMFHDEVIRKRFLECCQYYDENFDQTRIVYTTLAAKEGFIGPVAFFVYEYLFEE